MKKRRQMWVSPDFENTCRDMKLTIEINTGHKTSTIDVTKFINDMLKTQRRALKKGDL